MRSLLARPESDRSLTTWNPWSGLMDLQKSMNRLFADLDFPWIQRIDEFNFAPSCEAQETEREVTVKFDVPGIRKEDLKIEVQNNRLSISGERREEKSERKGKTHFSEVLYGSFARSFALPAEVSGEKVQADLKDGVLTVHVPKAEGAKAKVIEIRS